MALKLTLAIIALTAATAIAQDQPAAPRLMRVDQAVADLDALATSSRDMQGGLRVDGYQHALYRIEPAEPLNFNAPPAQRPAYLRLSPGVSAQFDRVDYMVRRGRKGRAFNITPRRDGEYFELVSANTVFVLSPIDVTGAEPTLGPDYRINARIDTKLDLRVDGRAYQSQATPVAGVDAPRNR